MKPSIEAICFDIGNTLRSMKENVRPDLTHIRGLQAFLGEKGDPEVFMQMIRRREKEYRRWAKRSLIELTEADLWANYILPEYPEEFIRQHAITLNQMWRNAREKCLLPDAVETVKTLASRGYTLAIISNTTSSVEVPQLLEENGLSDLFSCVILSTTFGRRKPHPSLFLSAARQIGVHSERCAYVGDDLSRDLVGARQSGYGEVVIIRADGYRQHDFNPDEDVLADTITEMKPDHRIHRLSQLLEIYPKRRTVHHTSVQSIDSPAEYYDAALSTMWGVDQAIPFEETFQAAWQIGLGRFELNHKVSPELYRQWDRDRFYISTVHDPCPAEYGYDELKQRDLMISSLVESRRRQGVDLVKRTIDLACSLGSHSVVLHAGMIQCDRSMDERLREMYALGSRATPEYHGLLDAMKADRAQRAGPHVENVLKSLVEIIAHAEGSGIRLGLENRYRFYDIPLPDEMALFLNQFQGEWIGFQYDVGHAQALGALGLVEHMEWLERFGSRMVGVHLHDVIGITDHQVPGHGEVDFRRIAPFLPAHAQKTLEIGPQASLAELAAGLRVLGEAGCIEKL